MARTISLHNWDLGAPDLFLIAGPCVIESRDHCLFLAEALKKKSLELGVPLIFKASYDKANRTSINSFRGPGIDKGLRILEEVKRQFEVPILSDIHETSQAEPAAEVLDVIQIPAFLCRQTDLLLSAALTGRIVNVKKGQFLSPWDMKYVIAKIESVGSHKIILTERGTSFGYNNLVVDFRALAAMRELGYPVIFDATHSVQLPGGAGGSSSGQSEYVPPLARAAVALGVSGVFMEVHQQPSEALSDGANALPLEKLSPLLRQLKALNRLSVQIDEEEAEENGEKA